MWPHPPFSNGKRAAAGWHARDGTWVHACGNNNPQSAKELVLGPVVVVYVIAVALRFKRAGQM